MSAQINRLRTTGAMWYVIQTIKGRERIDKERIEQKVAEKEEVFILESERMYKIKGKWIKDRTPLFPGYIFVDMDETDSFVTRLHNNIPNLKLLEVDGKVTPLRENEEEYLRFIGGEEHVTKYSEGFRNGDTVEIVDGAFAGFTGEIRRIDRHRRLARIVLPFMGRDVEVEIGLGIVKSC